MRKAEVSGELADNIVFRIVAENLEILLERFGGLAFLQQFLSAVDAPPKFGSIDSFGNLWHE